MTARSTSSSTSKAITRVIAFALLSLVAAGCPGTDMPGSCADPDLCPEGQVCALGDGNNPVCVPEDNLLGPRACADDDDCNADERCVDRADAGLTCIYAPGDAGS